MSLLLPTTLVGSSSQSRWLLDRSRRRGRFPPRVRAAELRQVAPAHLEEAQDDATRLALADRERAGVETVPDGEMRRESDANRFATALAGVDLARPGTALDRSGHPNPEARVTGRVERAGPVRVRDVTFAEAHTDRRGMLCAMVAGAAVAREELA